VIGAADERGGRLYIAHPVHTQLLCHDPGPLAPIALLTTQPVRLVILATDATRRRVEARIIDRQGGMVAAHTADPGHLIRPIPPSTVSDEQALLLVEKGDSGVLRLWDYVAGDAHEVTLDLPGEVDLCWNSTANEAIVGHRYHGRTELLEVNLISGQRTRLDTPEGWIPEIGLRPDGTLDYRWSNAATPPTVKSLPERAPVVPAVCGSPSVGLQMHWVSGPAGPIHVLTSKTPGASTGAVFLVHGGPAGQDPDAFSPEVAAWVDSGFDVVQTNYRGSSGYGAEWQHANHSRPGLTELEDLRTVRDWALRNGLARPRHLVLAGNSWGGYVTLLAAGKAARAWDCYIAVRPIADYLQAFADEPAWLQTADVELFGGSPHDVPDRYIQASPLTYVSEIQRPTLLLAAPDDDRCRYSQIDNFMREARRVGSPITMMELPGAHWNHNAGNQVAEIAAQIDFATAHTTEPLSARTAASALRSR